MSRNVCTVLCAAGALAALAWVSPARAQAPLATGFSYQGRLIKSAVPVNGNADIVFRLYDAAVGGALQGTLTFDGAVLPEVVVTGGLFTVTLDFGVTPFDGDGLWLEIDARFPANVGGYSTLTPRQPITPTPYALQTRGLFVNNAFNIGMGTVSPVEKVQVSGNLRLDNGFFLNYWNNVLAANQTLATRGLQSVYRNTTTGDTVTTHGVSFADHSGFLEAHDQNGVLTAWFDADNDQDPNNGISAGTVLVRSTGTGGAGGEVEVQNNGGTKTASILGGTSGNGSSLTLNNGAVTPVNTVEVFGDSADGGLLQLRASTGLATVSIDGDSGDGSFVSLRNVAGSTRIALDGDSASAGVVTVYAADGSSTVFLDGEAASSGGLISCRNNLSEETIQLLGDDATEAGRINVYNRQGALNVNTIQLEAQEDSFATGARLLMRDESGANTFFVDSDNGPGAYMQFLEPDGSVAMDYLTSGKTLTLRNAAGTATITFNGATGVKSSVVQDPADQPRLMYAMESPEVWFEDFGSGQLVNGQAVIALDPLYLAAVTVDEHNPIKVFITLTDECNGVFVQKGIDGFTVRELGGGTSNATFDYRVVAKSRGNEALRLDVFEDTAAALSPRPSSKPARSFDGVDAPPVEKTLVAPVSNKLVGPSDSGSR